MTDIRPNWCCGGPIRDHEDKMCGKNIPSMRINPWQKLYFDQMIWSGQLENNNIYKHQKSNFLDFFFTLLLLTFGILSELPVS